MRLIGHSDDFRPDDHSIGPFHSPGTSKSECRDGIVFCGNRIYIDCRADLVFLVPSQILYSHVRSTRKLP